MDDGSDIRLIFGKLFKNLEEEKYPPSILSAIDCPQTMVTMVSQTPKLVLKSKARPSTPLPREAVRSYDLQALGTAVTGTTVLWAHVD